MKPFRIVFLLFLFLGASVMPAHAASKVVAANLTENFVGISEGFDGAKLTLFGVLKNKADAVIVVEGPPVEAKVRAKSNHFGIWINGDPEILSSVPSFYAVASSRPVRDIASAAVIGQYGFDIDDLAFAQSPMAKGYAAARKKQGLFFSQSDGVRILESNLFRTDILLPASVPIGRFTAHIYEIADGQVTAERTESFDVAQVGLTASVNAMAHAHSVFYALLSLFLSLGIGGGSAYIVKRMS